MRAYLVLAWLGVMATASTAEAAITFKKAPINKDLWGSTVPGAFEAWNKIRSVTGVSVPNDLDQLYRVYAEAPDGEIIDLAEHVIIDLNVGLRGKLDFSSVQAFVAQQLQLPDHIAKTPALYKGRLVTVGFEHEFLKIYDRDNALKELGTGAADCEFGLTHIDHVELVKSKEKLNNLPFLIETDAGNELELVTPPFFIPVAAPNVPFPDSDQVAAYRSLMNAYLGEINEWATSAASSGVAIPLDWLLSRLQRIGITWNPQPIVIAATSLGPKTPVITKGLTVDRLVKLCVRSAAKGKHLILTQANIATSAEIYTAVQHIARQHSQRTFRLPKPFFTVDEYFTRLADLVLIEIHKQIGNELVLPAGNPAAVQAFLLELAAAAAKQMAVPALARYNAYVLKVSGQGQQEKWPPESFTRSPQDDIKDAENIGSHVKDWQGWWLKTSLYNFALATLTPDQMTAFSKYLTSKALAKATDKAITALKQDVRRMPNDFQSFKDEPLAAVGSFNALLDARWTKGGPPDEYFGAQATTELGFSDHLPFHVGPRQDTYLGNAKVQRPDLWTGVVLYVIETREDDMASLEIMSQDLKYPALPIQQLAPARAGTFYTTIVTP